MSHPSLIRLFACLCVAVCAGIVSLSALTLAPDFAVAQQDQPTEEATPEQAAPEQAAPEQATPEQAAPEEAAPEQAEPEEAAPEQAAPEEAAPENPAPEESKVWDIAKPCENTQHPYQADLCQQWRAAEAAEKTAAASEQTLGVMQLLILIGAVATLLLLLMFIPLFLAAFGARRAARNAAGGSAVPASDRDREEELRAYVDVDKLEFIETPESEGVVKAKVAFRNSGQTPALKIRSCTEIGIRDVADEALVPTMPLPDRAKSATRPRLGRDATTVDIVQCDSSPSLADRVMNGDATIVVWGFIEYVDIFDRKRRTIFQYLCNADTLDTGQIFKPMTRGDEEA
jgi:hypothetical protein